MGLHHGEVVEFRESWLGPWRGDGAWWKFMGLAAPLLTSICFRIPGFSIGAGLTMARGDGAWWRFMGLHHGEVLKVGSGHGEVMGPGGNSWAWLHHG